METNINTPAAWLDANPAFRFMHGTYQQSMTEGVHAPAFYHNEPTSWASCCIDVATHSCHVSEIVKRIVEACPVGTPYVAAKMMALSEAQEFIKGSVLEFLRTKREELSPLGLCKNGKAHKVVEPRALGVFLYDLVDRDDFKQFARDASKRIAEKCKEIYG